MPNYVLLRQRGSLWEQFTAQNAKSPAKAIEIVVTVTGEAGTYIAVPARSWKPQTWPKDATNEIARPRYEC